MSFKSVFERNPICILDKRHWESSNGLFDWLKHSFWLAETLLIGWNTLFQANQKARSKKNILIPNVAEKNILILVEENK